MSDAIENGPVACVGLPVQYFTERETLPGVLQHQSLTDPALWDVTVSRTGAAGMVTKKAVRYSLVPKAGCWGFLPGLHSEG